jgi:hypothetical protein
MQEELGDDAKFLVIGMGSISFHMPTREVLELHEVLYVLGLTKNLLSISCLIDLKCMVEFDDQQVIIKKCSLILVEFWLEECVRWPLQVASKSYEAWSFGA